MSTHELVGVWSPHLLYDPGAQADDLLLFMPDGTGRYEFINWILCSADEFEWDAIGPCQIRIVGKRRLELSDDCKSLLENAPSFGALDVSYVISEEKTRTNGRIRSLQLSEAWPLQRRYGFARPDFKGLEEPQFELEE
jgi:hypothetical protein